MKPHQYVSLHFQALLLRCYLIVATRACLLSVLCAGLHLSVAGTDLGAWAVAWAATIWAANRNRNQSSSAGMANTMTDEAKRKRGPTAGGGAVASGLGGAAAAAAQ